MLQQELVQDPRFKESFAGLTLYGVTGTNGSGKDALMDFMAENGFFVYNTSDDLRQIANAVLKSTARGGNDSPMGRVGNAERAMYPGGPTDLGLIDWWARAAHLPQDLKPRGLVIGSLRAVGEVNRLKEFGGKLIMVDADPAVRYARLKKRGRAYEENISYQDFLKEDTAELAPDATDPTKFGMAAVFKMTDITIENASDDIEVFKQSIRRQLLL